jgi:hypothetical protein
MRAGLANMPDRPRPLFQLHLHHRAGLVGMTLRKGHDAGPSIPVFVFKK